MRRIQNTRTHGRIVVSVGTILLVVGVFSLIAYLFSDDELYFSNGLTKIHVGWVLVIIGLAYRVIRKLVFK